jgi:hypothetical protein
LVIVPVIPLQPDWIIPDVQTINSKNQVAVIQTRIIALIIDEVILIDEVKKRVL